MFSRKQITATASAGAVAFGLFAVALSPGAGASKAPAPEPRPELRLVPFDVNHPEVTADLASVPITATLDPVEAKGALKTSSGGRAFAAESRPGAPLADGVTLDAAVELPRAEALAGFSGERRTRVNYRGVAQRGGVRYQVSVLQPSVEDATKGIEAPGDPARVGNLDVFNAYSALDESWATSIENDGAIVTVVGGDDPAARVAVARAIGLVG